MTPVSSEPLIVRTATEDERKSAIDAAVEALRRGDLVGLPTETVYGLAGDARSDAAVAKIYAAKGRPAFNPLIAHVDGARMAGDLIEASDLTDALMGAFWPGALTIAALAKPGGGASKLATAGLPTLAVRAPGAALAREVIAAFGGPVVAPSANPSGRLSPTSAAHVAAGFTGRDGPALILDNGPCEIGIESTIVRVDGDEAILLRPGGLAAEAIEAVTGAPLRSRTSGSKIDAPGQIASHYAPIASLRLNAEAPTKNEAFLAFGAAPEEASIMENLSPGGDLTEAAANLFEMLWRLDAHVAKAGLQGIAVARMPDGGVGAAINDRLARAAAPRDKGAP